MTLYVVMHADWSEPPGEVIRSFWSKVEAEHYAHDEMFGHGYSVIEVNLP